MVFIRKKGNKNWLPRHHDPTTKYYGHNWHATAMSDIDEVLEIWRRCSIFFSHKNTIERRWRAKKFSTHPPTHLWSFFFPWHAEWVSQKKKRKKKLKTFEWVVKTLRMFNARPRRRRRFKPFLVKMRRGEKIQGGCSTPIFFCLSF